MKKALALILSAAAVMCLFASCGKIEGDTTAEETSSETTAESVTEAAEIKAGEYQDETSQRAVADVEITDGVYKISVNWGSSATETVNWAMTAELSDGKLVYSDCVKSVISTDEANPSSETEYENGEGYFEVSDGKLLWTGASEEDCKECVFVFDSEPYNEAAAVVVNEGNYGDETSQRAGAVVTKSGDNYIVDVTWSDSNASGYEWTMTCTLEGNRLTYTDCKEVNYVFADENSDPEYTTIYENGTGYFTVENGKLLWDGAADADCQECVFAL